MEARPTIVSDSTRTIGRAGSRSVLLEINSLTFSSFLSLLAFSQTPTVTVATTTPMTMDRLITTMEMEVSTVHYRTRILNLPCFCLDFCFVPHPSSVLRLLLHGSF